MIISKLWKVEWHENVLLKKLGCTIKSSVQDSCTEKFPQVLIAHWKLTKTLGITEVMRPIGTGGGCVELNVLTTDPRYDYEVKYRLQSSNI